MEKTTIAKKNEEKRHRIIEKIEHLNSTQASLRHRLKSLETRKKGLSEKTYEKTKEKLMKKIGKIRKKILDLETSLSQMC